MAKGKGIFGNDGCVRCGGCCVVFKIYEQYIPKEKIVSIGPKPVRLWKKAEIPCEHLKYDFEKKIASCDIYDNGKPSSCISFACYNGDLKGREEWISELIKAAEKLRAKGLENKIEINPSE